MTAKLEVERRDVVAHCPFPVYGLDSSWIGRRWIGGWSGRSGNIGRLTLAHGDVQDPTAPVVRVDTCPITAEPAHNFEPRVRRNMARSLVQHLWNETAVYSEATPSTFRSDDPTRQWDATSLDVNGKPTEFSFLPGGAKWVALGKVDDALLGISARNVELVQVRLTTIVNPMVYLQDEGGRR